MPNELEATLELRASTRSEFAVQVMRPQMATAAAILPYLRRIDESRIYSNFGPLVEEFGARLARRLDLAPDCLSCTSSGTAALTAAVLSVAGRATEHRPLALLPAYTFVATAAAVQQCGYRICLADIDPHTWTLDPNRIATSPVLNQVGVVIPVAAYGRSVRQAPWLEFMERTGIPVVVDGAAAFETGCADPSTILGDIPVAMSFHATKSLACGEGGAVVCTNPDTIRNVERIINFGFYDCRTSRSPSLNGKMSEYHAAVGLAELDGWDLKSRALHCAAEAYGRTFVAEGLEHRLVIAPEICSSYALLLCEDVREMNRVRSGLRQEGIESRLWYGHGLHQHEYFPGFAMEKLQNTEGLAPRILGLPMAPDLGHDVIPRIVSSVRAATNC